jgi:hypothetical protein
MESLVGISTLHRLVIGENMNRKQFRQELQVQRKKVHKEQLERIGKLVAEKWKLIMLGYMGKDESPLTDTIKYTVTNSGVSIYSDNDIVLYLEKGTRPHIIRPKKPGGSLAFRTKESGTRKDGSRYSHGDTIYTKEVHHPGFEPRPAASEALFLSQNEIKKILSEK